MEVEQRCGASVAKPPPTHLHSLGVAAIVTDDAIGALGDAFDASLVKPPAARVVLAAHVAALREDDNGADSHVVGLRDDVQRQLRIWNDAARRVAGWE